MSNPGFPDHFSAAASGYASFRPSYPAALVDHLARAAPARSLALEFGCGSGQLTAALASRFSRVIAIDASAEQIAAAPRLAGVEYRVGRAEDGIAERGIADLIVAAQAAHWFDLPSFYSSAARAARPDAILALASYGRIVLEDPALRAELDAFYDRELAGFWPAPRRHVEEGYRSLAFPLEELPAPEFAIEVTWTAASLLGYVDTWSAIRSLERAGGRERFERFAARLHALATGPIRSRFPIALRVGRFSSPRADG